MYTLISLVAGELDSGKSIYQFLKQKAVSTSLIRSLKKDGLIHINKVPVYMDQTLLTGDKIQLLLPLESSESLVPERIDFEVLYEDEDLLIINKPAGVAVHPTFNHPSGTLANGVMHYWQTKGLMHRFRAINRLDKDTTGIILIALNLYAYNRLSAQQESGSLIKQYAACVHGFVVNDTGTINLPIGRKEGSIIEREVRADGQHALTHYRVLKRYNDMTLLEIQLLTGRTHQIRVHFSFLGHPLLGDDLYGGSRAKILRQALHASSLTFSHPRTEQTIEITAAYPIDILQLLGD